MLHDEKTIICLFWPDNSGDDNLRLPLHCGPNEMTILRWVYTEVKDDNLNFALCWSHKTTILRWSWKEATARRQANVGFALRSQLDNNPTLTIQWDPHEMTVIFFELLVTQRLLCTDVTIKWKSYIAFVQKSRRNDNFTLDFGLRTLWEDNLMVDWIIFFVLVPDKITISCWFCTEASTRWQYHVFSLHLL